jgi:hypothetical protein
MDGGGWVIVVLLASLGLLIPNDAMQAVWFVCCFFWVVIAYILKDREK